MVYVRVVIVSCAVTVTWIVFVPTSRLIACDAEPLVTVTPLTFTVALACATVGVTVIVVTLFVTLSV